MDTAASTSNGYAAYGANDGYAIPISNALTIAGQIEAGTESATVHIGGTPLLGLQIADATSDSGGYGQPATTGATVVGVVQGASAANAGLVAGDVITGIDGSEVTSASALERIILAYRPGASVSIAYSDDAGQHSATVTLGSGPPQ